jgi:hypothetical protein
MNLSNNDSYLWGNDFINVDLSRIDGYSPHKYLFCAVEWLSKSVRSGDAYKLTDNGLEKIGKKDSSYVVTALYLVARIALLYFKPLAALTFFASVEILDFYYRNNLDYHFPVFNTNAEVTCGEAGQADNHIKSILSNLEKLQGLQADIKEQLDQVSTSNWHDLLTIASTDARIARGNSGSVMDVVSFSGDPDAQAAESLAALRSNPNAPGINDEWKSPNANIVYNGDDNFGNIILGPVDAEFCLKYGERPAVDEAEPVQDQLYKESPQSAICAGFCSYSKYHALQAGRIASGVERVHFVSKKSESVPERISFHKNNPLSIENIKVGILYLVDQVLQGKDTIVLSTADSRNNEGKILVLGALAFLSGAGALIDDSEIKRLYNKVLNFISDKECKSDLLLLGALTDQTEPSEPNHRTRMQERQKVYVDNMKQAVSEINEEIDKIDF